jgi:hypothetical protein
MSDLQRSRHASSDSRDLRVACLVGHPNELDGQTLGPAREGLRACRAEGSHDSQSLHLLLSRQKTTLQQTQLTEFACNISPSQDNTNAIKKWR